MLRFTFLVITILIFGCASNDIKADFDIDKLSIQAKDTNKSVMIFFHKDYCGFCEKMEETIDSKKIQQEIKKDFLLLSINIDDDEIVAYQGFKGNNHKFAKEFGVTLYPTLIFIDGNNKAIYLTVGYRKKEELSKILEYIRSKSYKTMEFETFKTNLEFKEE
ncbi:MAG: thioredoxin fold domain-containing protein [Sulfurovaceae bacterium]|nr:thioredoxin fold domain-containing protein [Sulfurovaceae bacterium]